MSKITNIVNELKDYAKSLLPSENPSQDDLNNLDSTIKKLDSIEEEYTKLYEENLSCKDVIYQMHLGSGSKDKPQEPNGEPQPKTIEECMQEVANQTK